MQETRYEDMDGNKRVMQRVFDASKISPDMARALGVKAARNAGAKPDTISVTQRPITAAEYRAVDRRRIRQDRRAAKQRRHG